MFASGSDDSPEGNRSRLASELRSVSMFGGRHRATSTSPTPVSRREGFAKTQVDVGIGMLVG